MKAYHDIIYDFVDKNGNGKYLLWTEKKLIFAIHKLQQKFVLYYVVLNQHLFTFPKMRCTTYVVSHRRDAFSLSKTT